MHQHQAIGEEHGVVQKRLRDHQRERKHAAAAILAQHRARDQSEAEGPARMHFEPAVRGLELPLGIRAHALLDVGDRRVGLPRKAVRDQPARALRHMPAHQEDAEAQHAAHGEGEAPADIGRKHVRVEEDERGAGACDRAHPEAAVDDDVDAAAIARRHQLVDGGIDGGIFPADAEAGDRAEEGKAPEAPRRRREQHADEIDDERDVKDETAAEAVGHPAEDQRADHGAGHIGGGGGADLSGREPQRERALQHGPDRADDGDLEAVEDPGDPERNDDEDMKPAPREPVEPGGNVGDDGRLHLAGSPRRSANHTLSS